MDINSSLRDCGYVVIPNVLDAEELSNARSLFYNWINTLDNTDNKLHSMNSHGIFKFHQAGHQEHAWYIRTLDSVQRPFKDFYKTDELIASYDGCCWITPEMSKNRDNCWTHTDQAPCNIGLQCVQGFVSLTDNINTSFVVYEGSHKLHEPYFKEKNINHKNNWCKIDTDYLKEIEDTKRVLKVDAGSLVLWDSRTFHQNQYGKSKCEERIVQYICYLPKSHLNNTASNKRKRIKYFNELRTTSHWSINVRVNGLQPQTYGDKSKSIDYSKLVIPDLTNYKEKINKLL